MVRERSTDGACVFFFALPLSCVVCKALSRSWWVANVPFLAFIHSHCACMCVEFSVGSPNHAIHSAGHVSLSPSVLFESGRHGLWRRIRRNLIVFHPPTFAPSLGNRIQQSKPRILSYFTHLTRLLAPTVPSNGSGIVISCHRLRRLAQRCAPAAFS